jgi:hypothetical protein
MRVILGVMASILLVTALGVIAQERGGHKKGLEKGVVVEMVEEKSMSAESPTPRVMRIVDKPNKIVCYIVDGAGYSGFSCVHSSDVKTANP